MGSSATSTRDRLAMDADELCELTGKKYAPAQRRALDDMRIPHRTRGDGKLYVLRRDVLGEDHAARERRESEPDFTALLA